MPSASWIFFRFNQIQYSAVVHRFLGKPIHYVLTVVIPDNPAFARDYFWDMDQSDIPGFDHDNVDEDLSLEIALAIRTAERKRFFSVIP